MKKAFFLVVIAAGIGAAVAVFVNQKQKFAGMSEEDIRSYLDQKLGGRMSEDQVKQIQDAVVSTVKGASAASDKVKDVASNASDTASGVAGDAKEKIDDVVDKAKDAVGKAKDASADAAEAAEEAVEAVAEAVDES